MAIVVVLKDDKSGSVYMGTDSQRNLMSLSVPLPKNFPRLYEFSGMLGANVGIADIKFLTSRVEDIYLSCLDHKEFDLHSTLVNLLTKRMPELKKSERYNHKEGFILGEIVLAHGSSAVVLNNQLNLVPVESSYWAFGKGAEIALGSLATSEGLWPSGRRVMKALEAVAKFEQTARGPFVVKHTTPVK